MYSVVKSFGVTICHHKRRSEEVEKDMGIRVMAYLGVRTRKCCFGFRDLMNSFSFR